MLIRGPLSRSVAFLRSLAGDEKKEKEKNRGEPARNLAEDRSHILTTSGAIIRRRDALGFISQPRDRNKWY